MHDDKTVDRLHSLGLTIDSFAAVIGDDRSVVEEAPRWLPLLLTGWEKHPRLLVLAAKGHPDIARDVYLVADRTSAAPLIDLPSRPANR
jgi:hypothetical protein